MVKYKNWLGILGVVLALAVPVTTYAAGGPPSAVGAGYGTGGGRLSGLWVSGAPLTAEQEAALNDFLLDEHHALATYESVMAQFGEVVPFVNIAQAEEMHIAALERIFSRYGLDLPTVPDYDVPAFDTVQDACAAAVQAEIDNAALYDRLTGIFTQPDVLRVTSNLRNASLEHHLPAFQACVDGETPGWGMGGGMGRGMGRIGGMSQGPQVTRGRGRSGGPFRPAR